VRNLFISTIAALVLLGSIFTASAASANTQPQEVTFPQGMACYLQYERPNGEIVTLTNGDIPTFTVRSHNGEWDRIRFDGGAVPIVDFEILPCSP